MSQEKSGSATYPRPDEVDEISRGIIVTVYYVRNCNGEGSGNAMLDDVDNL